jgi:hypothetical protein
MRNFFTNLELDSHQIEAAEAIFDSIAEEAERTERVVSFFFGMARTKGRPVIRFALGANRHYMGKAWES